MRRSFCTRLDSNLLLHIYPLAVIFDGVTLYNLGHTLAQAAVKLKARHGHTIAPSTLAAWIDEHRDVAVQRFPGIAAGRA